MIPDNYKGLKVVSWRDTKEEWYNRFMPYFDKALEMTDTMSKKEFELRPREFRVYQNHFDVTTFSRTCYNDYIFKVDDGQLRYDHCEGDFYD